MIQDLTNVILLHEMQTNISCWNHEAMIDQIVINVNTVLLPSDNMHEMDMIDSKDIIALIKQLNICV